MKNLRFNNWRQIIVWMGLFAFLLTITSYFQNTPDAILSAVSQTMYFSIMFYFTYLYIFPKWYKSSKYYIHLSFVVVLISSLIFFLIEYYLIAPYIDHARERPPLIFLFIRFFLSNSFIFTLASTIRLMDHTNKLVENEKFLIKEKLETELKLLKAQINPHFIFNALNNIYSLTYMQAKTAPESVLKLSEMLRYVFYDCSKDRVSLTSEIKYIENFTAFQQMKSAYEQNISLRTELAPSNLEIAPMLFVPFVENAFKYSRIEEDEQAFVKIDIHNNDGQLNFRLENSFPPENRPISGSGTGIKNVKHRLEIIYPDKHKLEIKEEENVYIVNLTVQF